MKNLLSATLLFWSIGLSAQDSLIRFSEIHFNSEFEKTALSQYLSAPKSITPFHLLIASGQLLTDAKIKQSYDTYYAFVEGMDTEKFRAKKSDKKVKEIYNAIHDRFLKKYEERNVFEEVFVNGQYNCVSGTALLALAMSELEIPYQIMEKPDHVFLIAFPDKERILVEATTPTNGYSVISPAFKQQFTKMLKEQKVITSAEFSTRSTDDIFERHFFKDQLDVSLTELAGIQYSNQGIHALSTQNHAVAANEFAKANLLYPCRKHEYLLFTSIAAAFNGLKASDEDHPYYLAKLSRFKMYGINDEQVKGEYYRVIQNLLSEKGDVASMELYNTRLMSAVKDTVLSNELSFLYHYEHGRLLYNKAKFQEVLEPLKLAMRIKPAHEDAQQLFLSAVGNSLRNSTPRRRIAELEKISNELPQLVNNNHFNEALGISYLLQMQKLFEDGEPAEGEKIKLTFENFLKTHPTLTFDQQLVAFAYGTAAVYYFRKNQTSKAKAVINKGLEISPDNYELLARKKMIQ